MTALLLDISEVLLYVVWKYVPKISALYFEIVGMYRIFVIQIALESSNWAERGL